MTAYISNIRFSNNDAVINVRFDLWSAGQNTSHVLTVNVATGNIDTSVITTPTALLALRTAQKNAFVRQTVAQRRNEISARLRRQEEREAA
jgi:hypothetical protein